VDRTVRRARAHIHTHGILITHARPGGKTREHCNTRAAETATCLCTHTHPQTSARPVFAYRLIASDLSAPSKDLRDRQSLHANTHTTYLCKRRVVLRRANGFRSVVVFLFLGGFSIFPSSERSSVLHRRYNITIYHNRYIPSAFFSRVLYTIEVLGKFPAGTYNNGAI